MQHGTGWIPDRPDVRDLLFSARPPVAAAIPSSRFLVCPPVWNQGGLGSCTIHGAGMGIGVLEMQLPQPKTIVICRLQGYLEIRRLLGPQYIDIDSGGMIRDAIKVLAEGLVGPESLWPYDENKFRQTPPSEVYEAGIHHPLTEYRRLFTASEARESIAAGFPVVFGFSVRSGQLEEAGQTGVLQPYSDHSIVGGHAVVAVGYDDNRGMLLIRNSWGNSWGTSIPGQENLDLGNFWVPYEWFDSGDVSDRWSMMNWAE